MKGQRGERAIAEAAGARQPGEQIVRGRAAAAALRGEQLEHERALGGGPGLSVGAGAGDRQAEADAEAETGQGAHDGDTSGRGTRLLYDDLRTAPPALSTFRVS